ncbi:LamG-like jellyroll fold domain-containing protein [Aeoliella mucimassa]|uniref:LamG-like jellyroll fold domain-containing protein n=1 Tax=Aeoliella mucimassa TaxID=2527972 RepID=A0A518AQ87_9BACT|nr:LamG-like jellyroll fold domain-containing protein [Aeoliella mucimassa]QDU56882.1 hypothetical protein Pan181_30940 [Aeoliella mucimassa]
MNYKHWLRPFLCIAFSLGAVPMASATQLLYNFEGDIGTTATDKLTGDGVQDGTLLGNISLVSGPEVPFGGQAALFEVPSAVNPPFSTVQVPGSTALGDVYTLAVHANINDPTPSAFRIFSNYPGTGGVGADRIIFDHQPTYLRAIIGGTVISAPTATSFPDAGYHHYALTVDNGTATIYMDGMALGSGAVPTGNVLSTDLLVGEDTGGASNEQIMGNIDDILVMDEALSAADIMQLASGASAASMITPTGFYAANYGFEGAAPLSDLFVSDGVQDAVLTLPIAATVDADPANAAEGSGSLYLQDASTIVHRFSQIETPVSGTDLGSQFTLSSVVNVSSGGYANDGLIRLFTNYPGGGSASNSLIVDFNPDADQSGIGIRLLLPGSGNTTVYGGTFSYDEDHLITTVYDDGEVSIYLDGELVAENMVASGGFDLGDTKLLIGEDSAGSVNENLLGIVDDVLILDRALTAAQVQYMSLFGAEAMLAVPEPSSVVMIVGAMLVGVVAVRRRENCV